MESIASPVGILDDILRCLQFILCFGDGTEHIALLVFFRIEIQIFENIAHQGALVVTVVDREAAGVAQCLNLTAQDAHTGGVEGADPDRSGIVAYDLVDTFAHLTGGLVGEGQCKNMVGTDPVMVDQIGDAVCQNTGLSGTCSGQDQQWPLVVADRLCLRGVQSRQHVVCCMSHGHNICISSIKIYVFRPAC